MTTGQDLQNLSAVSQNIPSVLGQTEAILYFFCHNKMHRWCLDDPLAAIKCSDQSNSGEKGLNPGHTSRMQSFVSGRSRQQMLEAAVCVPSTTQKPKTVND